MVQLLIWLVIGMNDKRALLLNSSYEALSIISDRRAFKLLFNDKVDVLSSWNDNISLVNGSISTPSVLKLKKYVSGNFSQATFNRKTLLKRDNYTCQYCGIRMQLPEITIDHVIPKSQNGKTTFLNCVVCCKPCNSKKSNKTVEQVNMQLLRKPYVPSKNAIFLPSIDRWHDDWSTYIGNNI